MPQHTFDPAIAARKERNAQIFRNPPEEVSELFRTVLNEDEFRDRYRLIVFAIIDDHNANGRNLEAFRKTFGSSGV